MSNRFKNIKPKEKGQMAVFLMMCLVLFVALLSIVVNSSIITAQKIKLQNTADLAALAATDVLSRNLNEINKLNRAIEEKWLAVQLALLWPRAKIPGLGGYPCQSEHRTCLTTGNKCTTYCTVAEESHQKNATRHYEYSLRLSRAQSIKIKIEQANEKAYQKALDLVLAKENLPRDILNYFEKEKGGYPGREWLTKHYEDEIIPFRGKRVSVKFLYKLNDDYKNKKLFSEINEGRPFILPKWRYTPDSACSTCNPAFNPGPCEILCGGLTPDPIASLKPTEFLKSVPVKVLKDGPGKVYNITTIEYLPMHDLNLFSIGFRKDDYYYAGYPEDRDRLFRQRNKIEVISMAKPDGGKLATGEASIPGFKDIFDVQNRIGGIVEGAKAQMVDFTRNKLIGLADEKEIGVDLNKSFKDSKVKKEDFWH